MVQMLLLLKGMYTFVLYVLCISYSLYILAKFLYMRRQIEFRIVDWVVHMFLPLLSADLLGSFAHSYLTKSTYLLGQATVPLILMFNNAAYILKFTMVAVTSIYLLWRIISSIKNRSYKLVAITSQALALFFFLLLLILYFVDSSSYIFGNWNKVMVIN